MSRSFFINLMPAFDGCFSTAAWKEKTVPMQKLPKDIIVQSVERLSKHHPPPEPLPPLLPRISMSTKTMDEHVTRLYGLAVERRKQRAEMEENQLPQLVKSVRVPSEVLQSTFVRLHDGEMARRHDQHIKLKEKHIPPRAPETKLPTGALQLCNERLYTKSLERMREKQEELYNKYVKSTAPRAVKLSSKDLAESAQRLSGKK